ncbi:MAG: response regulator [Gammaproteobacteria bacterium]|nr:response regulator [Gammaproteobacteria bacterium]
MTTMKALVVDDSKLARLTLRKLLVARGVEVEQAESGEEALSHMENSRPDIVFMDNQMPNMNGIDAMRAIKDNPDTGSIPVIMCTGQDEADFKANAVNNGAAGVLAKPPVVEELEEVLEFAAQPRTGVVEHEAVGTLAASGELDEFRNMLEGLVGQFSVLARKLERLESESPAAKLDAFEQRIAALEGGSDSPNLGDLPHRIEQLESASPASTLEEFSRRLSQIESRHGPMDLGDLPDRIARLESESPAIDTSQVEALLGKGLSEHQQATENRFSDLVSRLETVEAGTSAEASAGSVDSAAIVAEATDAALEKSLAAFEDRLKSFGNASSGLSESDLERVREVAAEVAGSTETAQAGGIGDELNDALISEARRAGEDAGRSVAETIAREAVAGFVSATSGDSAQGPASLTGEVQELSRKQKSLSTRIALAYLFAAAVGGAAIALPFLQKLG